MNKFLNFCLGILIIFIIQYLSIFITKSLNIIFPAPIFGIILLFIFLKIGLIKENWIKDFCEFIIKHMILFFIPMFVGIMVYQDLITKNFLNFFLIIVLTTSITGISVGLFIENIIKYKRLKKLKEAKND
ncbi:MAG: CidA/LrgA family protein [Candidatus Gastranaerophilales bacterium]|nr:CidA/LrgA family protein [Candidatus Gastranaerophilales bacterium]